MSYIP